MALMLLASAFMAPAAGANHSATAAASLTLEPLSARCKLSENAPRSACNGSRVARIDWSVTCGGENAIIAVDYLAAGPAAKHQLAWRPSRSTHPG